MADEPSLATRTAELLGAVAAALAEGLLTSACLAATAPGARRASLAASREAEDLALILKTRALLISGELGLD